MAAKVAIGPAARRLPQQTLQRTFLYVYMCTLSGRICQEGGAKFFLGAGAVVSFSADSGGMGREKSLLARDDGE